MGYGEKYNMSRPTRKLTFWTQPKHAAQANPQRTLFASCGFNVSGISTLYLSILLIRNVSARISMRRLYRLIWVDTLSIVYTVRFLVERLIYTIIQSVYFNKHVHVQEI